MSNITLLLKDLKHHASPKYAKVQSSFFKTGPGQYAEGDQFIGIRVPALRTIAKEFHHLPFNDITTLLKSPIHEQRLIALFLLINRYESTELETKKGQLYRFYTKHMKYVNNWDLVDLSAPQLVGVHLYDKNRSILNEWSKAKNMWFRRISIVSTWHFIRQDDFNDTLKISKRLLDDEHDLIHKAVGWMLREVGKRDFEVADEFLQRHYANMPRTMLRYAIERYPEKHRKAYLKGEI